MKSLLVALSLALAGVTSAVVPLDVEAKRLGGGRPAGIQRSVPTRAPDAPPPKPAQPTNATTPAQGAAAGAAAAPARRSWMGPIAGLAAGLGIAALMSHLGLSEAFGNFLMMALLAVAAVFLIRWLMRRFGAGQGGAQGARLAGAGAPFPSGPAHAGRPGAQGLQRQSIGGSSAGGLGGAAGGLGATGPVAAAGAVPEGFDAAGFERIAKMIFIRLQAANDEANVEDLRKFTTPELFASLRLDLQERGPAAQRTDVLQLDAELVDTAQEDGQWLASVRFHGLIREEVDAGAERFNELWHLVKPVDGSREWAIAGITPLEA